MAPGKYLLKLPFQFNPGNPGLVTALQALDPEVHTRPHDFPVIVTAWVRLAQPDNIPDIQLDQTQNLPNGVYIIYSIYSSRTQKPGGINLSDG